MKLASFRLAGFACVAMVALQLSTPAGAQQGSHLHEPEAPNVPLVADNAAKQREIVMKSFADCVVDSARARRLAREFIAMDPQSEEAGKFGDKVTEPGCLPKVGQTKYASRLAFTPFLFRYELFGALYRKTYRDAPSAALKALPVRDYAKEFASGTVPNTILSLRQFGDCVARIAPAESHSLVMSDIYTAEENNAITAVLPNLQACMPPGQSVSFGRGILRGALAEGLYRLREIGNLSESSDNA
ncbi:hypothetical protein [Sphingopyxis sp.]|uniref:hypothetical protein n=1 Tax=Sphingopyxis sp. TaxID=1908224 RepID=UPI0025D82130|nr:hypothetical protein [Sphingopyxis sp.]MBK6413188.1 hypothetical protein [Sphingopyxis sp.]